VTDWLPIILAAAPATQGGPKPFSLADLLPYFLIIMVLFYLIILRPQRREQQDRTKVLDSVERGDRVITIGGIHGKVDSIDLARKTVTVDVGRNVKIEFSRNAVSSVEKKGARRPEETGKEAQEEKKP
jgi:preprotein translocase subunit YajC